jgi:3-oxoacyl-[acyl-carrier-protein] synthase-3
MTERVTTLQRIETAAPEGRTTVEDMARQLGLTKYQARLYRRIRGLDQMRSEPGLDLFDLVATPAQALLASEPDPRAIRYLIYAHSVQDLTPSHIYAAERLRERLGLADAESFAVAQNNCANALIAIDVAGELLRAEPDPAARALVVTGENPAARLVRIVANTSIMGEAASACLVGLDGPGGRVLSYVIRTAGQFSEAFLLAGDRLGEFNQTYSRYVVDVINEALDRAGVTLDDITLVVPHNVNVSSWLRLCERLELDRSRVFLDTVAEYSHCYCTDPFLNLATMRERGLLTEGGLYLVVAVGIGAAYAAMVIGY